MCSRLGQGLWKLIFITGQLFLSADNDRRPVYIAMRGMILCMYLRSYLIRAKPHLTNLAEMIRPEHRTAPQSTLTKNRRPSCGLLATTGRYRIKRVKNNHCQCISFSESMGRLRVHRRALKGCVPNFGMSSSSLGVSNREIAIDSEQMKRFVGKMRRNIGPAHGNTRFEMNSEVFYTRHVIAR